MAPIVDAHVHVYRTAADGRRAKASYSLWEYGQGGSPNFSEAAGDPPQTLAAMDAAGVDYAVCANLLEEPDPQSSPGSQLLAANEWLCKLAQDEPRMIPFVAVDPRYLGVGDLVDHLRHMVATGPRIGVKIHPPVQRMDVGDETYWPIFAYCEAEQVPVLAHAGPSENGAPYGEPDAFRPLLDALPRLRVWLAHLGGASWPQVAQLAADYPSLHFDLCEISEWIGAARAPSAEEFADLIRTIGPKRLMMGSDFPWYDMASAVGRINALAGFSGEEKAMLLGGTATQFLQIAGSP